MILTCCICGKDFKVKNPLINMCNSCSKESTKLLKKMFKKHKKHILTYSDFLKFQKENPREDKSYNEMLVEYGL